MHNDKNNKKYAEDKKKRFDRGTLPTICLLKLNMPILHQTLYCTEFLLKQHQSAPTGIQSFAEC